jgi:type II restriction enzyme
MKALVDVVEKLDAKYGDIFEHEKQILCSSIVSELSVNYPGVNFKCHFNTTYLMPDGGLLYVIGKDNQRLPILISEAKRQGTNNLREAEGLAKQAKGNAIERLGKNVSGFRIWLSDEKIFPFVVFGEGVDFDPTSSILDRVSTIALFAPLNTIEVENVGPDENIQRGSFFFRVDEWTVSEMSKIMLSIAEQSLIYYKAKYGLKSI